jgi:zinc transport system substrate-binding protein
MKRLHASILIWLSLAVLPGSLLVPRAAVAAPKVVVSILPIHSLVAAIMQDVGEPELLIRGGRSPHDFSLKPSDMRLLQGADLVIWIGPELETPLADLFAKGRLGGQVETLIQASGVDRLVLRAGDEWEPELPQQPDAGAEPHEHAHESAHAHERDSHIWLSPAIARRLVAHLSDRLSDLDPANAARYRQNSRRLVQRLARLDAELAAMLSSVRDVPFVVFHDAYHYFEQHYGLRAVGAVSLGPHQQPGARHIHELRAKIERLQARCVFAEPQFQPKLVATLIDGTHANAGRLDPLGSDLDAGAQAYFRLMQGLARNLLECLQ